MRRIVICDTGPLLHLSDANAIHLLHLAGEVIVSPIVAKEFEKNAPDAKLPDWIQVKDLDDAFTKKTLGWSKQVDAGEAAAIALTLQEHAEWLLSDDAKARQLAELLSLEVHGSIGLLLWGVAAGHIGSRNDALSLLNALADSSLWISDRVLRQARQAIDTLFSE